MVSWITVKNYDEIKRGKEVVITVEAKNREPMTVFASLNSSNEIDNSGDYDNYKNAIFNGEVE